MLRQQLVANEIKKGERFQFGENWKEFLQNVGEDQILQAELALKEMLGTESLPGKTFLDIGSGSGIHSLAAHRLGARVISFDYDPSSVWCTSQLRQRYYPNDPNWQIDIGSALDQDYLEKLGVFDIVYSWGVLHHTGDMWQAMDLITDRVGPNGILFLAIYNDQGWLSRFWRFVKRTYNQLPKFLRPLLTIPVGILQWGPAMFNDFLHGRPFFSWKNYYQQRGMSPWRDVIDWVGGYPFEVARRETVLSFYEKRGFKLQKMISVGRQAGNNQFIFLRIR